LHSKLAVVALKFTQPGPVRDSQRRLLTGAVDTISPHPIPDRALIQPALTSNIDDRTGSLDHHLHYLVPILRAVLSTFHVHPMADYLQ
jgi:hypothetical protein